MSDFSINLDDYKILVIEDALEYKQLISSALGRSESHIYVSTLAEAENKLNGNKFDCIILDLSLPDGNGFDLLKSRVSSDIPIIILTSSQEIGTKIMGLSMGAQDYISKPFDSLELAARVKNKITLFQKSQNNSKLKEKGNLSIDIAKRYVHVAGKSIDLTRKEYDCLSIFIENEEIVLTREILLNKVWGDENYVLERSVDSTLAGLRKKLKNWNYKLKSIYGVGYQLKRKEEKKYSVDHEQIKKIFITESEKQLKELNDAIYLAEWELVAKLVHKLKGTFSIFSETVIPLADRIDQSYRLKNDIAGMATEFHNLALRDRDSIIQGTAAKKAS